jgi:hypothetical protein
MVEPVTMMRKFTKKEHQECYDIRTNHVAHYQTHGFCVFLAPLFLLFCFGRNSLKCTCPKGYHGPACELTNSQTALTCTLACQNGGECRNGAKDTSMFTGFGPELSAYNKTHNGYWEHCVCPEGFFGIQCEHQLEICPGGQHVCLHGSKCVANGESNVDTTTHECDCDSGFDAVEKYAGKFCQYSSTDICTVNGRPGVGKANFAFCVNNGTCKKKVADTEAYVFKFVVPSYAQLRRFTFDELLTSNAPFLLFVPVAQLKMYRTVILVATVRLGLKETIVNI